MGKKPIKPVAENSTQKIEETVQAYQTPKNGVHSQIS